jgi:hypothetical protein
MGMIQVPWIQGEQSSEVIFQCVNDAFSRIPAVATQWQELAVNVVAIQWKEFVVNVNASRELSGGVGYFIIEVWEPWLNTSSQDSNGSFIGGENM